MPVQKSKNNTIGIFDLLLLWIGTTSLVSVGLLSIQQYYWWVACLLGIVLATIVVIAFHLKLSVRDNRFNFKILLIIVIALAFRVAPFFYVAGGQDEGIYVNMSKQFDVNHGTIIPNSLRSSLDPDQQKIYDQNNQTLNSGLVFTDNTKSNIQFNFYPLNGVWLSITGNLLGDGNQAYALTFFSIITILALTFLAIDISGKELAGYIVGLLLALNPVFVFFSKMPVSEVLALSLTASATYLLIRFLKSVDKPFFLLFASALLFGAFSYARLSSFIYVPLLAIGTLIIALSENVKTSRNKLFIYVSLIFALLVLGNLFYLFFYPKLFWGTYNSYIISKLGQSSVLILLGMLVVYLGLLVALVKVKKIRNWVSKFLNNLISKWPIVFGMAFIAICALSLIRLYALGFTNAYQHSPVYKIYGVGGHGLLSIIYLGLYQLILYLSPISLLILAIGFFNKKLLSNKYFAIFAVIFFYFLFVLLFVSGGVVNYLYYYSRYYLTEVIPLALLLLGIVLASWWEKKTIGGILTKLSLVVIALYFSLFSAFQLYGREGPKTYFFDQIRQEIPVHSSLLFAVQNTDVRNEMETPLKYFYGYRVFDIKDASLLSDLEIKELEGKYTDVFAVSSQKLSNLKLIRVLRYEQGYFADCNFHHLYAYLGNGEIVKPIKLPFCAVMLPSVYRTGFRTIYLYEIK